MHRRLFLASTAGFVLALAHPARASDADIARQLVGIWAWRHTAYDLVIDNQLTLAGNGDFALTSVAGGGAYQVTQTGVWQFGGGWIQFRTTWSSSLDPTGNYLVMSPIQVLEVTDSYFRTPDGTVTRIG